MRAISSATRTSRIEAWLETNHCDMTVQLRLEVPSEDGGPEVLASWHCGKDWERATCARQADSTLQNTADELGTRVHARLCWYTANDAMWCALPLRGDPVQGTQSLDGSAKSMLVQMQRHSEAYNVSLFTATESAIESQRRTLELQARVGEQREQRVIALELEVARLRDENSELRAELDGAMAGAEASAEVAEEAVARVEELKTSAEGDKKVMDLAMVAISRLPQKEPKKQA